MLWILWILCGVINYGLMFAYFQREWAIIAEDTYYEDVLFCTIASLLGPMALFVTLLFTGFGIKHGFKWY